jgi:anti-sigma-K factor RskA
MEQSDLAELDLRPGPRLSGPTLAALAALVGLAAIALGGWAFVATAREPNQTVTAPSPAVDPRLVSLLARPDTVRVPLRGSVGRIVLAVDARNLGFLVLDGLAAAPIGRSYQAWLIRPGERVPVTAALFDGTRMLVPLAERVPFGATVAVTLERAGGAPAPTRTPRLLAQRRQ